MALFDPPDLEKLKRDGEYARLIDWANYTKNAAIGKRALAILREDPYGLVYYLYETAAWTQRNSGHKGRRLPRRGIMLLKDASNMLVRIGSPVVPPLVDSLSDYEHYGDPEIKTKLLYLSLVIDVLERMGNKAAVRGLRALAGQADEDVRGPSRDALKRLSDRGLLDRE